MNRAALDAIARAVLYEGFVLYPYRPSSVKNRRRFPMGGLWPRAYCEASPDERAALEVEVLVEGPERLQPGWYGRGFPPPGHQGARVEVFARFLQLVESDRGNALEPWHEARERETAPVGALLGALAALEHEPQDGHDPREAHGISLPFTFDDSPATTGGAAIRGRLTLSARAIAPGLHRVRVRLENAAPLEAPADRDAALLRSLASPHVVLSVEGGALVSAFDPPAHLAEQVAACRSVGAYPVLVGERGSRDTMLASPIILHDWPRTAPESPGDLFDACEIDEILTLRILTLTDDEKREVRAIDPRARALLDRTEALGPESLSRLHGALRDRRPVDPPLEKGAKVRIRPRRRADAFDMALAGKAATVASVERDFEGRLHYALTVDDDPGADLGHAGFPGHRFFYGADELEPIA